jgi:hypothetical protein
MMVLGFALWIPFLDALCGIQRAKPFEKKIFPPPGRGHGEGLSS